jgi:hypothetical protein
MKNEVLCKFIAHNLCVLNQEEVESGVKPDIWGDGNVPLLTPKTPVPVG